jgi:hypothetical protein
VSPERRLVSAATLIVTVVIVVIMGFWGYHSLTAPIDKDTASAAKTDDAPSCAPGETETVQRSVRRNQIKVSVYNAGKRAGRAGDTMNMLEAAGFLAGAIGNAPSGTSVARAEVHTTTESQVSAKLVALAFGANTPIVVDDSEPGPGVNVYIGDKFHKLLKSAPKTIQLPTPNVTCH